MQTLSHDADVPPQPRELRIPGVWAYMERLDVAPAGTARLHVSAPGAFTVEWVRLGCEAVLAPEQSIAADRDDCEILAESSHPAAPHGITPGSFVAIGGPPVEGGDLSLGLWLRLWRLPEVDVVQFAWQSLIAEIDYPHGGRFGLVVDHLGRIGMHVGDGGPFRHAHLHFSPPLLAGRLGQWVHVAASVAGGRLEIYVDGQEALARTGVGPVMPPVGGRVLVGALLEGGRADALLDGDIARPFLRGAGLTADQARLLHEDRGSRDLAALGLDEVLAEWPLTEEKGRAVRDTSGHGRHGTIVNHATWMVGGPRFDPNGRLPGDYDPAADPDHGHGLRLSSDDLIDAGWPVAATLAIPEGADSGTYAARVRLAGQPAADELVVPFVVTRPRPRRNGAIAVLMATNTWHAYGRRPTNELAVYGLSSTWYSTHLNGRPFYHLGERLPLPLALPYGFESARAARTRSTHLVRSERFLEAWLRREGYAYEVITDLDLHRDPGLLAGFAALAIVGHSEYWTDTARNGLDAYLAGGGNVLCMSGDTLSVRVAYDEEQRVFECRKIVFEPDRRWLAPDMWGESWHSSDGQPGGTFRRMGKPAWDILGLSFKGMIDDGTPSSFGDYELLDADHALLRAPRPVALRRGERFGAFALNGLSGASGYEFDASPDRTRFRDAPVPGAARIAAATGQRNIEWLGDPDYGAELVCVEHPSGGRVVNFGSIAAASALPVDPVIADITHNTLALFGVAGGGGR